MLRDVSMSNDDALSDVDEPATPLPWKMLATLELHNTQDNVIACIDCIRNTLSKNTNYTSLIQTTLVLLHDMMDVP